jgi:hypothetical protein
MSNKIPTRIMIESDGYVPTCNGTIDLMIEDNISDITDPLSFSQICGDFESSDGQSRWVF